VVSADLSSEGTWLLMGDVLSTHADRVLDLGIDEGEVQGRREHSAI